MNDYCLQTTTGQRAGMLPNCGATPQSSTPCVPTLRRSSTLSRQRLHQIAYPHKQAARSRLAHAVAAGIVTKSRYCECGRKWHLSAHHDDYAKPLEVRWLCRRCHPRADAERRIRLGEIRKPYRIAPHVLARAEAKRAAYAAHREKRRSVLADIRRGRIEVGGMLRSERIARGVTQARLGAALGFTGTQCAVRVCAMEHGRITVCRDYWESAMRFLSTESGIPSVH